MKSVHFPLIWMIKSRVNKFEGGGLPNLVLPPLKSVTPDYWHLFAKKDCLHFSPTFSLRPPQVLYTTRLVSTRSIHWNHEIIRKKFCWKIFSTNLTYIFRKKISFLQFLPTFRLRPPQVLCTTRLVSTRSIHCNHKNGGSHFWGGRGLSGGKVELAESF